MGKEEEDKPTLSSLTMEVHLSRKMNSEQHDMILRSAKKTQELSDDINEIISSWQGFVKVIAWAGKAVIFFGVFYAIYHDKVATIIGN